MKGKHKNRNIPFLPAYLPLLLACLSSFAHTASALRVSSSDRRSFLRFSSSAALSAPLVLLPPPASATPVLSDAAFASLPSAGRAYFPALTPPFFRRATVRYDLGRGAYALEQLLTFGNVTATIRTNVIRMADGESLFVHGPLYPTGEYRALLDGIEGKVRHVVVPCNAIEHKAALGPFLKECGADVESVWIAPGQYGPLGSCGTSLRDCRMGCRVDGILPTDLRPTGSEPNAKPPWSDEFDYRTLYVSLPGNAGPVSEVAFVHRPTKTLLSTDAVVYVPDRPTSPLFDTYFPPETTADPSFWPRTVLQSVFLPLRTTEGDGDGRYPGFKAVRGRLVRAPILRSFVDARAPEAVRAWVDEIVALDFDRIATSHFASPVEATPEDVRAAFGYLYDEEGTGKKALPPIECRDWEFLGSINDFIGDNKLGAPVVFDVRKDCIK